MKPRTSLNRLNACLAAAALFATLCAGIVGIAHAARTPVQNKLSETQIAIVQKITTYFNLLRDLQGEFIQAGPGDFLTHGIFYLSKPGRLRFEYAPPNPILVVADGQWVIVKDRRLETADHYPISATPLKIVLADKIDLLNDTKIIQVYENPDTLAVTLEDRSIFVPGRLTLKFDRKTMALTQWIIVDGQGQTTSITVSKLIVGEKADPALFKVHIPNRIESDEY